jgi:hypothetical protein
MSDSPHQILCLCPHLSGTVSDSAFSAEERFLSWEPGRRHQRSVRVPCDAQLLRFLALDALPPGGQRGLAEGFAGHDVACKVFVPPAVHCCFRSVATGVPSGDFFTHAERCRCGCCLLASVSWCWLVLLLNCLEFSEQLDKCK